jgi:hypothetical protein
MQPWPSSLNVEASTQSVEKFLLGDKFFPIFVELPKQLGPPQTRQPEKKQEVLVCQHVILISHR